MCQCAVDMVQCAVRNMISLLCNLSGMLNSTVQWTGGVFGEPRQGVFRVILGSFQGFLKAFEMPSQGFVGVFVGPC